MRERALVVGPAWVGDMVMAQALFITLHAQGAEVDVLAPRWSLPLLARMREVNRAIALPLGHGELGLGERWRIGRRLRAQRYDRAIVMPRSLKSALVPFFARIPLRTGYRGEHRYGLLNDIRPLDENQLPRVVDRYVALGLEKGAALPPKTIPQPRLRADADNQHRLLGALGLDLERPVIACMPGAEYGTAKRWPLAHYAALARALLAQGYHLWILGSAKEAFDGEWIAANAPGAVNLCGKTQLEDAVDLLALASGAVSNDSGLMHVAAASGAPLVALYGSSTPTYTPPLADKARALYLGLACSPCFKRQCPIADPASCLHGIAPEQALAALREVMAP